MPQQNAKVAIELYVDDNGTLRVRQFRDEATKNFADVEQAGTSSAEKIKAAWATLKGSWIEITAAVMAFGVSWNMINTAAKARQEEAAFASLAASYGANGKTIIAELREVSNGTVDTMTIVRNGAKAMMMGLNPDNVVQLMKIAMATTRATGQTAVQAFEDIALASARESKMIMDNLGIMVSLEKANENYAKANHLVVGSLTDVQQKQAFLNETFRVGGDLSERLGNQTNTMADRLARYNAEFTDFKNGFGDFLLRLFNGIESVALKLGSVLWIPISYFERLVQGAALLTDQLHLTSGATELWGQRAEEAMAYFSKMNDKGDQAFRDMLASGNAFAQSQVDYKAKIEAANKALEEQEKTRQKILDKHKQEAEKKAAAEREMYEEAGFGAEKYFTQEANELVRKSIRWKEAGADIYEVEQWLYNQIGELAADAYEKGEVAAGLAMNRMQEMSGTLAEQFAEKTLQMNSQLAGVGVKVDELNGQEIGLTAHFDGSAVVTGIDSLINKFEQLRMVAAAAPAAPASSSAPAAGSYENTNASMSAEQVAANESAYYNGKNARGGVTVNINQQLSRSDVTSIVSEQRRREARS